MAGSTFSNPAPLELVFIAPRMRGRRPLSRHTHRHNADVNGATLFHDNTSSTFDSTAATCHSRRRAWRRNLHPPPPRGKKKGQNITPNEHAIGSSASGKLKSRTRSKKPAVYYRRTHKNECTHTYNIPRVYYPVLPYCTVYLDSLVETFTVSSTFGPRK